MGLSICHGIVRSLGGEITATSTPGSGSIFRVVLPAAVVQEEAPAPGPTRGVTIASDHERRQTSVRTARVLVVDDEPMMGSAIGRVLAEHDVSALTSARTALKRILAGERYDVILCDVMMPDFSGMDLYEAIAAQAPDLLDRLVFVTGGAYTPDAIEFLERIANRRLEKPILPAALHEAVAQTMAAATRTA